MLNHLYKLIKFVAVYMDWKAPNIFCHLIFRDENACTI